MCSIASRRVRVHFIEDMVVNRKPDAGLAHAHGFDESSNPFCWQWIQLVTRGISNPITHTFNNGVAVFFIVKENSALAYFPLTAELMEIVVNCK